MDFHFPQNMIDVQFFYELSKYLEYMTCNEKLCFN